MSKRKERKKKQRSQQPNIPQETLDRVREQVKETGSTAPARASSAERRRRREISRKHQDPQARQEQEAERIAEALKNPTKVVSEEDLQNEYAYVLKDLRSMGILAAVLFVVLIVLAQFI